MFPKQVNFRELFSNPGAYLTNKLGDISDSQGSSQQLYSQLLNSQPNADSQDQGSQNSYNNSPGKMFHLQHAGDRALNKHNYQENFRCQMPISDKITNQLYTNISNAKERDERDLLMAVLNAIHENSSEVQKVLARIHEGIKQAETINDNRVEACFQKVSEIITNSNKEVIKMLEVREAQKSAESELKQQLTKKDTRLGEMEVELCSSREESYGLLIEKLSQVSEGHHVKTQEMIKEICNQYKHDFKTFVEEYHEKQINTLKEVQHHYMEMKQLQEVHHNENISRTSLLENKLQQVVKQTKTMNNKLVTDIKTRIKQTEKQFKTEVENVLEKQIKGITKNSDIDTAFETQKHDMYKCFEHYKAEFNIQLQKLIDYQKRTLTCVLKDFILIEKEHTEKTFQEMQDNIQQRIESEIKKIEMCYKDQFEKIIGHFKELASMKFSRAIPPPKHQQCKDQVNFPATEHGRTSEFKGERTEGRSIQPKVTKSSENQFRSTMIGPPNSNISSQVRLRNYLFSDRYVNSSPVATVYPQLQSDKNISAINVKQFTPNKDSIIQHSENINAVGKRKQQDSENVIINRNQTKPEELVETVLNNCTSNKKEIEKRKILSTNQTMKGKNAKKSKKKVGKAIAKSRKKKQSTSQSQETEADFMSDCQPQGFNDNVVAAKISKTPKSKHHNKIVQNPPRSQYLLRKRANKMSNRSFNNSHLSEGETNDIYLFQPDIQSTVVCPVLPDSVSLSKRTRMEMTSYTYSTSSFHTKTIQSYETNVNVDDNKLIISKNTASHDEFSVEKIFPIDEVSDNLSLSGTVAPTSNTVVAHCNENRENMDTDYSDTEEHCQSQDSSPSMSINEIIRRKKFQANSNIERDIQLLDDRELQKL